MVPHVHHCAATRHRAPLLRLPHPAIRFRSARASLSRSVVRPCRASKTPTSPWGDSVLATGPPGPAVLPGPPRQGHESTRPRSPLSSTPAPHPARSPTATRDGRLRLRSATDNPASFRSVVYATPPLFVLPIASYTATAPYGSLEPSLDPYPRALLIGRAVQTPCFSHAPSLEEKQTISGSPLDAPEPNHMSDERLTLSREGPHIRPAGSTPPVRMAPQVTFPTSFP